MSEEMVCRKHRLSSFQIIILGFAGVILLGALLLMLPISATARCVTPFHEALFTATSAVCVTGLVVQDTGSYWSVFGQAVILTLIQIGGLGVVTVAASFALLSGRRISLMQRSTMQDAISAPRVGGIVRLTRFILRGTFLIELIGALAMLPVFCRDYGWHGIWMAVFHSISAFCNAGFDILGTNNNLYPSLTGYVQNPVINITIMLLIVLGVILVYYIAATLLPVDKIIGRIYPVFGFALLFMAVGILVVLLFGGEYTIPEFTSFENCIADAKAFPIVPMLFTTIACGAISGFHATQSPLMARCMRNERESRSVFYGAMISESIIALVWAAIAMAFWGDVAGLNGAIAEYGGQAAVMIDVIANKTLGPALAVFVIFGVVACAITSGDTAFRSARLIVADFMGVEQRTLRKRIYICIPLFALGLLIIFGLPFQTMWSYFAWMNQTLAAVTLWMIVAYLRHRGRAVWVGLIPALVMTYVCASYIFVSPLMLGMQNRTAAYLLGGGVTLAVLVAMIFKLKDNDAKGIS